MASGKGNTGERWKTTVGLISKKETFHVQHTFFVHIFAVVQCTAATWNFQKLLTYTFYGLKCRTFSLSLFFSLPLTFTLHWWPLVFLILSTPLQNCHVVLPTKKCLLCFLSLALDLCRPLSRWASLACRPLSLFLCLSLALYSKFVDMTIYLSLIL